MRREETVENNRVGEQKMSTRKDRKVMESTEEQSETLNRQTIAVNCMGNRRKKSMQKQKSLNATQNTP